MPDYRRVELMLRRGGLAPQIHYMDEHTHQPTLKLVLQAWARARVSDGVRITQDLILVAFYDPVNLVRAALTANMEQNPW